ncbi:acetyl-CoA C-acetyltransferase [bacterium]|nr:acetyl-CoA C-acetyltransferase [bacterium]
MSEIVFLSGARTAFGTFGKSLKDFSATELGVFAAKGAIERSKLGVNEFDHVVFGNAAQTSADAIYLARHVGLKAGLPQNVPAVTVNRLCGSGFESIIQGARMILLNEANTVLCGGAESMSQSPHVIRGARWGIAIAQSKLEDALWEALYDPYAGFSMALTGENLAEKYSISREETDIFALTSQNRAEKAIREGKFKDEIFPVEIPSRKGVVIFETDEHPRLNCTMEGLSTLKPFFKKDGVVTAGNASGMSDGAAAVVIASSDFASAKGLEPIGRLVSWGLTGCEPKIMGIGPVEASKQALKRANLRLEDIDLIEINEAFSPQYLAVEKELGLNREITNVNGGAIALGHPLAASGTRLTLTLLLELRRRKKKFGLASACIGGGQGAAVIVEAF